MNVVERSKRTPWFAAEHALLAVMQTIVFGIPCTAVAQESGRSKLAEEHFENKIRPLFIEHCIQCHGEQKQEGGLRLDSSAGMMQGGDSGQVVTPGSIDRSLLVAAVRYEDYEMPPSGKLPKEEIEAIETWVAAGATWPDHQDKLSLRDVAGISDSDRDYWAFQPLSDSPPPHDYKEGSPIDRFVARRLDEVGLELSNEADAETLLRRAYLSVLGVPPTLEERERYLASPVASPYEELIERLLDDPRYGQHWARQWLDLVRYAESDGYNQDASRPEAYLYRDWVIAALNNDMPYDEFVTLQLAGDIVAPNDPNAHVATGYLRHWIYEYNQRDVEAQWANILNDITDVTGEVFFGLGIGCARCHDHKFDPLLQKDYYRLQAAFASFVPTEDQVWGTHARRDEYAAALDKWNHRTQEIREELKQLEKPERDKVKAKAEGRFPPNIQPIIAKAPQDRDVHERQIYDLIHRQIIEDWNKIKFDKVLKGEAKARWLYLKKQLATFDKIKPKPLTTIRSVRTLPGESPQVKIPKTDVAVKHARFEVVGGERFDGELPRRLQLARWINAPENALAVRVIVNRIWQSHFGRGIVENSNDFGTLGTPPSHPDLLDWLAREFIDSGKSLKNLHRSILLSRTFRQAAWKQGSKRLSDPHPDPENRLLSAFPVRRLSAEQIRDSVLVVSGSLQTMPRGASKEHDGLVRSIYTKVKRNRPNAFLSTFDAPDASASIGQRMVTTTPNQSLLMANSPWLLSRAREMAARVSKTSNNPKEHIEKVVASVYSRLPSEQETNECLEFLRSSILSNPNVDGEISERGLVETKAYLQSLADLCHVMMNTSEFIYID